jgi:hypothetical protein
VAVKQGTFAQETFVTLQNAEHLIPILGQQMPKDMLLELERKNLKPIGSPTIRVEDIFFFNDETGETSLVKRISCLCRYEENASAWLQ